MTVVFLKLQIKNTQIGRNFCAKHTVFLLYMKLCVFASRVLSTYFNGKTRNEQEISFSIVKVNGRHAGKQYLRFRFCFFEKQPKEEFYQKICSLELRNIRRKAPVLEFLFIFEKHQRTAASALDVSLLLACASLIFSFFFLFQTAFYKFIDKIFFVRKCFSYEILFRYEIFVIVYFATFSSANVLNMFMSVPTYH